MGGEAQSVIKLSEIAGLSTFETFSEISHGNIGLGKVIPQNNNNI